MGSRLKSRVFNKILYCNYKNLVVDSPSESFGNSKYIVQLHGKKSVVMTAKLIFVTVKPSAGNERVNERMSRNPPK